ncbi:MAG: glycerophosphodiester phosphodiesterase [Kineosporiaceae bacterium]
MTLVVAHRGDPRGCVENTLPALLSAARLGAHAVEIDVRCTADGIPVLHHDATLARLRRHPGRICLLSREQLRRIAPDVPTLADALDAVRPFGVPLVVDVRSARAARAALEVVSGHRSTAGDEPLLRSGAVWFCGRPHALAAVRIAAPEATILLSWRRPAAPSERLVAALRPDWFNPWHRLLDVDIVMAWRRRGVRVSAWTVDDARRRDELRSWGVDAIVTNDVEAALADAVPLAS